MLEGLLRDRRVVDRVQRLELPFNRYGVDPYGVERSELVRSLSALGWAYHHYFSVNVYGTSHIPKASRAMIISNHSGGIAIDAAMILASCFFELEPPRLAQAMVEKFLGHIPGASHFTQKIGQLPGLPQHAERLLRDERLLMIFPEGARGTAKLANEADSLVRFGTGFMRLALATQTPIVPTAFLGAGDAIPTVMNLTRLGKLIGVPYIPVTPYLLPLPKPTTFDILFSEPMLFEGTGSESDDEVLVMVEKVKSRIRWLIEQGRELREGHLLAEALELR